MKKKKEGLFGFKPEKEKEKLFCGEWNLAEATALVLDIAFQSSEAFPKLLSELYAYSFNMPYANKALFDFLESRFNKTIVQDKEIHLHFEEVTEREKP